MHHIAPSLLCSSPLELKENMDALNRLGVDWYHIDVMDGHFVPNIAIGFDYLRILAQYGTAPFYAHLMVENPSDHIDTLAGMGVAYCAFHYETTHNHFRLCQRIREAGMKPAVALNPSTPVYLLEDIIPELDAVTLMAFEPGFSGLKFMPFTYERISKLKRMIGSGKTLIEVDGGIDNAIAVSCIREGCDVIVGGYPTLFRAGMPMEETYAEFKKALQAGGIQ